MMTMKVIKCLRISSSGCLWRWQGECSTPGGAASQGNAKHFNIPSDNLDKSFNFEIFDFDF